MASFRLTIVSFILLASITGCDLLKTEKDDLLFNAVTEIELQVDKKEWDKSTSTINEFQELYEKRKWKLQLLGEMEDYKEIELEMGTLKESLKDQDQLESKISLGQIMKRLQIIYDDF
ncbi:DUF4363 family protein [Virgibacillus byunsanensis]|uniref:DUF4363 family protein n=1 Tax=Virgibacillus byunsanensis TaxID=570945 RepID=A0ABW3LSG3_9BACI